MNRNPTPIPSKQWLPGGHKPFNYEKMANLQDLGNALRDLHSDIEIALEAIDDAEVEIGLTAHMRAAMILSGIEIKMTNFAHAMREQFLSRM